MDKLKIAKVDHVLLQRGKRCWRGTLHLTQHHIIFVADDRAGTVNGDDSNGRDAEANAASVSNQSEAPAESSTSAARKSLEEQKRHEVWIPYSLLWLVTRLASIIPLVKTETGPQRQGKRIYPLGIFTRNFEASTLGFDSEGSVKDVFESMKACAVVNSPQELYAFSYEPLPPLKRSPAGWRVYDFKAELTRQGVGTRTKAWRVCDLNSSYELARTYPARLCVPSRISDSTVRYAVKYRSKERIPALTYLHWANLATITRCSQPLVGFNNRSMQDEKLVEAIFTSHVFADPHSAEAKAASAASDDLVLSGSAAMERSKTLAIYGAQTTNLIVDARPTTNAMANRAKGAGTENMEHYKGCKKVYLGIDNIHVMRDSLQQVADALRNARSPATFGLETVAIEPTAAEVDVTGSRLSIISPHDTLGLDHQALKRSHWLRHISALLEGTLIITRNVHINHSHVLLHCSDGWDRTSQLAALAQICLDPYFRTMEGFAVLVEKDWISFGHQFWHRCGHASSERYFTTAADYAQDESEEDSNEETSTSAATTASGGFDSQSAANAFWGFTKQITANFPGRSENGGKRGANVKETSPVFHQFLDCVWQIMRQYPKRFEYNEKWLLDMYDGVFDCKYGTFLYDCEAQRNGVVDGQQQAPASSRTYSIWDAMLDDGKRATYLNKNFEPALDKDTKRADADMGVLLPNSKDVGFWGGLLHWSQDDINSLVRAEAEERKRQVEFAERLRREAGESARTASLPAEVGPRDVDGVSVGPVVSSERGDPVLRPDTASSQTQSEIGSLAYKARVRPSTVGRATDQIPSPRKMLQSSSATPQKDRYCNHSDQTESGTSDTTNMMRNMVMGWGARLQDAYTSATTTPQDTPTGSAIVTPSQRIPRVAEADLSQRSRLDSGPAALVHPPATSSMRRASPSAVPRATMSEMPRSRAGQAALYGNGVHNDNPWAAHDRASPLRRKPSPGRRVEGLPDTLAGHDAHILHSRPTTSEFMDRAPPVPKPESESKTNDESYDPLGVGLG